MGDSMPQIDFEYLNGSSADRRKTGQNGTLPSEMVIPHILSRMVQPRHRTGLRVDSGDVRALVIIAMKTSQREIF